MRLASHSILATNDFADRPHSFVQINGARNDTVNSCAGASSRDAEPYLPVGLADRLIQCQQSCLRALRRATLEHGADRSRLHLVWIATVCGKLETDFRYSNTLGWNTFPVPTLTEKNKADLTRCAEDILLAREASFPGDDRRPLRSGQHARRLARGARAQRRSAGAHLYRPPVPERHRAAGKAVRALHQDDRARTGDHEEAKSGGERMNDRGEIQSLPSRFPMPATAARPRPTRSACGRCRSAPIEKRGEQYLLIKSPPASGKSRALMFIALDKLHNQGLKQAIIVVPEKSIGASFHDEPLTKFGFWADWRWSRNGTSATRRARTTAARSSRSARFLKATTRCWSAPMRLSASPWTSLASRHSTTG